MRNHEVAEFFNEIADLLELQEENPFRIRAYRKAAQNIENLSRDIEELTAQDKLTSIDGVGEDLSDKIKEFLARGRVKSLDELRKKVPSVLLDMIRIPGMGPKTARAIHKSLHVKSLDDLARKAKAHKISKLPGVRERTEENILAGIHLIQEHSERVSIGTALPLAREIISSLKSLKSVRDIAAAGSVRRRKSMIRDIDILVTSVDASKVMDYFAKLPAVAKIQAKGKTKSSVLTRDGIQVDLRVVEPESFGAALQYFTGSKQHNIKLRGIAKKHGLKINEYGVFKEKTSRKVAGKDESSVYSAIKLKWISPELRENTGEIEAARSGNLPKLVGLGDIQGDLHVHTSWSDGKKSVKEIAEACKQRGYKYVVITDHSKSLHIARGLSQKDLGRQIDEIRRVDKQMKSFRVFAGSEVDILQDGSLDFPASLLRELDFVIAAIHSGFKQSRDKLTNRICKAMENPLVNMIAHPTGRLFGQRQPYPLVLEEVMKVACVTNTALEINSYPDRLDLDDTASRQAKDRGVMLGISTDTHVISQLNFMEYGVSVARRAWCERKHILNTLGPEELLKKIKK